MEVLAEECSYLFILDRRPVLLYSGKVRRDAHGVVREEGDTCLASQINQIKPVDQWRGQMSQPDSPPMRGW